MKKVLVVTMDGIYYHKWAALLGRGCRLSTKARFTAIYFRGG